MVHNIYVVERLMYVLFDLSVLQKFIFPIQTIAIAVKIHYVLKLWISYSATPGIKICSGIYSSYMPKIAIMGIGQLGESGFSSSDGSDLSDSLAKVQMLVPREEILVLRT